MLNGLVPVFALIIIGLLLRGVAFLDAGFWRGAERLTYYLLFPALLFLKLSTLSVSEDIEILQLAILLIAFLLTVSIILIILGYMFGIHAAAFTSLYQGGIRFNTYVGLAVVNGMLGDSGLAIAAVVVGIMIPVVNLLCITVFAFAGDEADKGMASVTKSIVTNPLILACVLGMLWFKLGWVLPDLSVSVLELLSAAALPMGLLSVGAGIHFYGLGNAVKPLLVSSIVKLFVSPMLAYMLCQIASQGAAVTAVIVILASLPTASSAYILSRELGGDSEIMAAIITGHIMIAMISMPLIINYLV